MEVISSKINNQNEKYDQILKNHSSSIHNIELQLGQLENVVTTRAQGHLPSNTEVNPKEQVKAITLRSGRELQEPQHLTLEVNVEKEQPEVKIEDVQAGIKEKKSKESKRKQVKQPRIVDTSKYAPRLPFPLRQRKMNDDDQRFVKFKDTFLESFE